MRFPVDECTGPRVARWLTAGGHEVSSVFEQARGMSDGAILAKASSESWIVVTSDKDFGEMVFRNHGAHAGIVLLRLSDERAGSKISALDRLLREHAARLAGQFVVVSEDRVRFSPLGQAGPVYGAASRSSTRKHQNGDAT